MTLVMMKHKDKKEKNKEYDHYRKMRLQTREKTIFNRETGPIHCPDEVLRAYQYREHIAKNIAKW